MIVYLYVDDMVYNGNSQIEEFKSIMKKEFHMTNVVLMKYFLGIEVKEST